MSLHHSHCSQYRFSSNNKYVLTHTDIAWIITKNKIITTINFYTPSWFINYLFKNATGVLAAARKSAMLTKCIFARLPLHSAIWYSVSASQGNCNPLIFGIIK